MSVYTIVGDCASRTELKRYSASLKNILTLKKGKKSKKKDKTRLKKKQKIVLRSMMILTKIRRRHR